MKLNRTFIIRHKETKETLHISSKSSWSASGHAKQAFAYSIQEAKYGRAEYVLGKHGLKQSDFKYKGDGNYDYRFDGQSVYEIVELKPKSEDQLKEAIKYLKTITSLPLLTDDFSKQIKKFIKEVEIE
jgi:hypothetical protein